MKEPSSPKSLKGGGDSASRPWPMAFHASNGVGKYGTHKSSYPLAMTHSLPWYRWPIEIEVYQLKMVDLSMSNC